MKFIVEIESAIDVDTEKPLNEDQTSSVICNVLADEPYLKGGLIKVTPVPEE